MRKFLIAGLLIFCSSAVFANGAGCRTYTCVCAGIQGPFGHCGNGHYGGDFTTVIKNITDQYIGHYLSTEGEIRLHTYHWAVDKTSGWACRVDR